MSSSRRIAISSTLGLGRDLDVGRSVLIALLRIILLHLFQDFTRRWNIHIVAIKQNCHLFQAVSSGFRVGKPDCDQSANKHGNEHEIVFPCDTVQRNRIDEDVEEIRNVAGRQDNCDTACAKSVWPNFSRVRHQKGCECNGVATKKNKKEGNDL